MNSDTFMGLANNAALLLALVVLYDVLPPLKNTRRWMQAIFTGVLLGFIGMAIMLTPWRFSEGVIFDTRSILLSMTGLFFGLIPTIIAVLMTVTLRVVQGGNGVFTGIAVILTSAGLGLGWRYFLRYKKKTPHWYSFYGFGLVVHAAMLLWMLSLPQAIAFDVLSKISLPVMVIYPVGTVLLGLLLIRQRQRSQWEQELRQERDLLTRISETSPVGIVTLDRTGQIEYANVQAEEILGLSRDKITQRTYNGPEWKVTSLDGGPFPEEQLPFRQVKESQKTVKNVHHAIEWPDGCRVMLSINAAPLINAAGQMEGMVASIEDITERVQAGNALRESEQNYRLLFDEMISGFAVHEIICDPTGKPVDYRFLSVNPAFEKLTGLNAAAVLGKTILEVIPGTESIWVERYGQVALTREPMQFENYAKALGKYFEVRAFCPELGKFATLFTDITERKRAEDQLKLALADKEILLQELYHRTKNNMQAIMGLIDLQAAQSQDEQVRTVLQETKNRVRSMALVHQKLYQSQNLSSIDLSEYIRELMALLMESYQVAPDRVSLVLELAPVPVLIDSAVPCGLILNELISNVFKHAFPDNEPGELRIDLKQLAGDEIMLQIADDGVGLPSGFDPRESGSLGLQTVFGIAEYQLQGKISCETGKGVTWRLHFSDTRYQPRV